jgi:hypothetical protein
MTKFLCFIYRLDRVEVVLLEAIMGSFSIAIDVALSLLGRATSARWHQEVLVHHAGSGDQKLGLVVRVLIRR